MDDLNPPPSSNRCATCLANLLEERHELWCDELELGDDELHALGELDLDDDDDDA